jgi:arginyl-tRNA synthetase
LLNPNQNPYAVHSYYNNSEFLIDDKPLQASRLQLIIATKQVLQNGLGLLGVSAPEKIQMRAWAY